jgi:uncharacterized OB-fold protein
MTDVGRFGLPVPVPGRAPEVQAYWDGALRERLLLPRCHQCGFVIWYPRSFCPACHFPDVEWIESEGIGAVYSFTITRHGPGIYRNVGPYVLAYVELDEGPRVMTNIVGCEPDRVHIGLRVRAVFDVEVEETRLLRFQPEVAPEVSDVDQ